MAKVKLPDGLETIEISMSELVKLHMNVEAVFAEGLFGWTADRQLAKIGSLAKQAIEYKIGDEINTLTAKRKVIEEDIRKTKFPDVEQNEESDREFQRALSMDKPYVALFEKQKELWETKIPDFQFVPVKVKIPNDVRKKIKKDERGIMYRDKHYPIEVYAALGYLVENNYIIETA